jgi:stage V sporulation protein D (sporulation-specific penicillin-binding protein)
MDTGGRIVLVVIIFFLFGIGILIRLSYWQVVKAGELSVIAFSQREAVKHIPASRGEILTKDNFPIVTNKRVYSLIADPQMIKAELRKGIAQILSQFLLTQEEATIAGEEKNKLLDRKSKELEKTLSAPDLSWTNLKNGLSSEEKDRIEKLKINGLDFEEKTVRFYPESSMAAQLVGFVGSDFTGEAKGYFGLEGYYDLELKGKEGLVIQEKDAFNKPILTGIFNTEESRDGKNIVLHVDRTVQSIVEEELRKAVDKYGAKSGWVIVADPMTGAIISMAAFPSYDPAKFSDYPQDLYKNPTISETYEPGSTFKVLVMSAAINEQAIKPQTKCQICDGPYKIDKYLIRTWNDKYYPGQTMTEVIQHSDNIGMVYVSQKLGKDKLLDYLKKFGIGEKTGIDLQEEANVPLKENQNWNSVDSATASFGQGLVVTGIQMIRAVAAIANGGKIMEPHVVSKIVGEDKTLEFKPKVIRQILKPETARQVTEMMVNAVDNGEAKWAKPAGFRIAGKTGTAQIPVAGHYDAEKTIASFIGFAPADNPQFIMLVYLREPTSSPWGSETAAPLFFQIAKKLFLYYGIQPQD